ncbi:hypothetical protein VVD49_14255 [Uliginosibacterium sp. H3]|uniref:Uncharacterized protein n=1 Tax=Uliginosibacterium silvisoli TaxID=3114758 RepID=A0ABU6K771_9RHOO|nr:hypothetical protein [Uliginosibacterium sp. H3]
MLKTLRKKFTYAAIVLVSGVLWGIVEFVALQRAAFAGRRLQKH